MINLTSLNGKAVFIKCIIHRDGRIFSRYNNNANERSKYVVLETQEEVSQKIAQFYNEIHILSNPHLRGEEDEE